MSTQSHFLKNCFKATHKHQVLSFSFKTLDPRSPQPNLSKRDSQVGWLESQKIGTEDAFDFVRTASSDPQSASALFLKKRRSTPYQVKCNASLESDVYRPGIYSF
jgi:hypothetical protein